MVTFETVSELSGAAAEMSKAAETMFCKEGVVTVDLREVEKADSAGLALLIDWMRQAKQHEHEIEYVNIPQQMMAIARVSGLDKVLPLTWD
ncbi:hypothetical protein BOW53_05890 [Solemya pervernicosa gill symbiont]|uniref:STAS domain-containing protein n=2 Tax=Gammaproteobacteria incertae sedis TaxID=118884 RepID=A0A1T2L7K2_9GAMM|nr:hypothetical protein BOW53_05890 [Solemya pervernicosa gill symbiont]